MSSTGKSDGGRIDGRGGGCLQATIEMPLLSTGYFFLSGIVTEPEVRG